MPLLKNIPISNFGEIVLDGLFSSDYCPKHNFWYDTDKRD